MEDATESFRNMREIYYYSVNNQEIVLKLLM